MPHVVLIEPMCSDLDLGSYLKGQGHTRQLKVSVHLHMSVLLLTYALNFRGDISVLWTDLFKLFKNVNLNLIIVQLVTLYLIY